MGTTMEGIAGVDLTRTSSTPEFRLGTLVQDLQGNFYQYVHAGSSCTQYQPYSIQQANYSLGQAAWSTGSYSQYNCYEIVVPQHGNFSATNVYGWAFCGPGRFVVYMAPGSVGGKRLWSSTTAGYLWQSTSSQYALPAFAIEQVATSTYGSAIAVTKLFAT